MNWVCFNSQLKVAGLLRPLRFPPAVKNEPHWAKKRGAPWKESNMLPIWELIILVFIFQEGGL